MTTTRMSEFEVALRREGMALGKRASYSIDAEGSVEVYAQMTKWLQACASREAAIAWCVKREEGGR